MNCSNKFSRLFGKIVRIRFPRCIQSFINNSYVRIFDIDMSDFAAPQSYESLNALFTRELKVKRKIQSKEFNLVSPTDSLIISTGRVSDNTALQIKGREYNVREMLGEDSNFDDYSFVNLYLSPRDYHHYHAPCDLEVLEARYFSGLLLPVNKPSLLKNRGLYKINERVVLKVRLRYNLQIAYYVAIGALNVGKMRFCFDSTIQSNAKLGSRTIVYENPISLKAGEEIGCFEMGSTVVLLAKANFTIKDGDVVKMGEEIGTLSHD